LTSIVVFYVTIYLVFDIENSAISHLTYKNFKMKSQFSRVVPTYFSATVTTTVLLTTMQLPVPAITFINQRASLGSNDRIDWSSLGAVNPFHRLPNSFSGKSAAGRQFSVTVPSFFGNPQPLVFQTSPAPGIETNFARNDYILFTGFTNVEFPEATNTSLLSIHFDKPVQAAGTQLALAYQSKPYQALISAFDSDDNLLVTFSTEASSSQALDNSAAFLGITSDSPNISRLVLRTDEANSPFGINEVSFVAVPESSFGVVGLLAFAVCGCLMLKRHSPDSAN
jgi:hypothetical protein